MGVCAMVTEEGVAFYFMDKPPGGDLLKNFQGCYVLTENALWYVDMSLNKTKCNINDYPKFRAAIIDTAKKEHAYFHDDAFFLTPQKTADFMLQYEKPGPAKFDLFDFQTSSGASDLEMFAKFKADNKTYLEEMVPFLLPLLEVEADLKLRMAYRLAFDIFLWKKQYPEDVIDYKTLVPILVEEYKHSKLLERIDKDFLFGEYGHKGKLKTDNEFDLLLNYYGDKHGIVVEKVKGYGLRVASLIALKEKYANEDNVRVALLHGFNDDGSRGEHGAAVIYIKENGKDCFYFSDTYESRNRSLQGQIDTPIYYTERQKQAGAVGCWSDALVSIRDVCRKTPDSSEYDIPNMIPYFEMNHVENEVTHARMITKLPNKLMKTPQLTTYFEEYLDTTDTSKVGSAAKISLPQYREAFTREKESKKYNESPTFNTYLQYRSIKEVQLASIQRKVESFQTKEEGKEFLAYYKENAKYRIKKGDISTDKHAFNLELNKLHLDFLAKKNHKKMGR